jgi:hypothetical protein
MSKMMKQFGRTMLIVMGLAVAAAVLSSIPAQAAGSAFVAHALVPVAFLEDTSNPTDPVFAFVEVVTGKSGQMLFYDINDGNGTFFYSGSGSIPASSINVSGGPVSRGNVTVTLNVNTCGVTGFTTSSGPCGTFNVTFAEVPPSVGGSTAFRGDNVQTLPGGGKIKTNGSSLNVGALATGTALSYSFDTFLGGNLQQQTNVIVTITPP